MNTCRVLVVAFFFCFAVSGAFADDYDDDDYYEHEYDDIIPAYGKLVGSGKKKVVLGTVQNTLTVCAALYLDVLEEVPKEIRSDLKALAHALQAYDGDNEEHIIALANDVVRTIEKGYLRKELDYGHDLIESLEIIIVIMKACESDLHERYHD